MSDKLFACAYFHKRMRKANFANINQNTLLTAVLLWYKMSALLCT